MWLKLKLPKCLTNISNNPLCKWNSKSWPQAFLLYTWVCILLSDLCCFMLLRHKKKIRGNRSQIDIAIQRVFIRDINVRSFPVEHFVKRTKMTVIGSNTLCFSQSQTAVLKSVNLVLRIITLVSKCVAVNLMLFVCPLVKKYSLKDFLRPAFHTPYCLMIGSNWLRMPPCSPNKQRSFGWCGSFWISLYQRSGHHCAVYCYYLTDCS